MFWTIAAIFAGTMVFVFLGTLFGGSGESKYMKESRSKLNALRNGQNNGFKPNWVIEGTRFGNMMLPIYAVAGNDTDKKGCYFDGKFTSFFSYSDIVKVELLVDDSVKITKMAPAVGKAIVGGVIAGAPGAVVGSLLGGTKTKTIVSSIRVKILFKSSSIDIRCLSEKSTEGNTQAAMQTAQRIVDKLTVIMAQTCK